MLRTNIVTSSIIIASYPRIYFPNPLYAGVSCPLIGLLTFRTEGAKMPNNLIIKVICGAPHFWMLRLYTEEKGAISAAPAPAGKEWSNDVRTLDCRWDM